MPRSTKVLLATLIGISLALGPTSSLSAGPSTGSIRPRDSAAAEFMAGRRPIEIHRAAEENQSAEILLSYFHKPILALEPPASPRHDSDPWPEAIHDVQEVDGETVLVFRFLSWTTSSANKAKEAVRSKATELADLKEAGLDPSQVDVKVWPTDGVAVEIHNSLNPGVPLVSGTKSVSSLDRKSFWVPVRLPRTLEPRIKELFENGRAELRVSLKWEALESATARSEVIANDEMFRAVESVFDSERLQGQVPLFRDERENLLAKLRQQVTLRVVATSSEVEKLLSDRLVTTLLDEPEWVNYESLDGKARAALAKHLEPLVDKVVTTEESDLDKKKNTETGLEAGASIPIEVVEVEIAGELDETWEREHGIRWETTETENRYVPHEIEITTVRANWQSVLQSVVQRVSLTIGASADYRDEDWIPIDFTAASIEDELLVDRTEGPVFAEIPRGAMLCFFGSGNEPPRGFAWADGQTNWPTDAGWLRESLPGTPVPDMTNRLVGGTSDPSQVATLWSEGVLALPKPEAREKASVSVTGGRGSERPFVLFGKLPSSVRGVPTSDHRLQVTSGKPGGKNSTDTWMHIRHLRGSVEVFSHPEEERTIPLNVPTINPPHVRCRWIVRVR